MTLVFATHNTHKLKEIQALLPQTIEVLSLNDIHCTEDITETSLTIEENALLKAKYISEKYGYNVFADDTGLEVAALNSAPGVFSARYAGEHKNDADNVQLLLQNMKDITNRQAQFKTVIALCWENKTYTFEGIAKGTIAENPLGDNGFGYDPIFIPEGYTKTFAEISAKEKNRISHRAKALEKLLHFLSRLDNH